MLLAAPVRVLLALGVRLKLRIVVRDNQDPTRSLEPLTPAIREVIAPFQRSADIARGNHAESLFNALHILLALDDDDVALLRRCRHNAIEAEGDSLDPGAAQAEAPSVFRIRIRALDRERLPPILLDVPARLVQNLAGLVDIVVIADPFPVTSGLLFRLRAAAIIRTDAQSGCAQRGTLRSAAIIPDSLLDRLAVLCSICKQILHLEPHSLDNRRRAATGVTMHQDSVPAFADAQAGIRIAVGRAAGNPSASAPLHAL